MPNSGGQIVYFGDLGPPKSVAGITWHTGHNAVEHFLAVADALPEGQDVQWRDETV